MAEEVKGGSFTPYIHSQTLNSHVSSDGRLLASVSADKTIRTYAIDDENPPVSFVRFSPNGKFILVGTPDNRLRLWNISTAKFIKTYTGHTNSQYCTSSAFSVTNGKRIISGSEDNCVYMWDLNSRKMVQKLESHTETVTSVTSHPTENLIASGSLDKSIRIWTQKIE